MALQPPAPVLVPAAPTPRARRSRVTLVVAVLVCVAVPVLIATAGAVALWWTDRVDTVGAVDFDRPLRIPALAGSTVEDDGTRVFDLTMQTGTTDLTGDGPTGTWGVDGAHLAPTLRAQRGETVRVDVRNDLPETSSLHWHGMHVPAAADGGPHQLLRPGSTWSPTWTVDQPAATTWYHPHAHGTTAEHVRRGVYGMFLVDDPAAAPAGLPGTYGVDDVPVMLQDAGFTPDGQLRAGRWGPSPLGATGDTLLVNGTVGPYLDVTTETVRLRLLNASGARVYDLALADGRDMDLVGTDGGLLPAPVRTGSVLLSPGERAEVVVRVEPGERVVLRSLPPDMGVAGAMVRMSGAGDRFDVLELRAADTLTPAPDVPEVLAPAPDLSAADATVEREFELSGARRRRPHGGHGPGRRRRDDRHHRGVGRHQPRRAAAQLPRPRHGLRRRLRRRRRARAAPARLEGHGPAAPGLGGPPRRPVRRPRRPDDAVHGPLPRPAPPRPGDDEPAARRGPRPGARARPRRLPRGGGRGVDGAGGHRRRRGRAVPRGGPRPLSAGAVVEGAALCDRSAVIAPVRSRPLARAWFAVTAVTVLVAVVVQVPLSAATTGGFFDVPVYRGLNVFAFFTIQSNLLVALSALLTALDPERDTLFRRWVRLTSLVAITVTGVVYHSVLAGLQDLSGLGWLADQLVHTVVPLLALLGWVLFGPRGRTDRRVVGLAVLFPLAWLAFTLVRGPLVGGFWPYPFVDVDELGWGQVLLNCGLVAVLFVGLAAAAHGVDRAMTARLAPAGPLAEPGARRDAQVG